MAKLERIVLYFDDGSEHTVVDGYTAVYANAERAKRANEKEPWDKEPPRGRGQNRGKPGARDMGKDDSSGDLNPRCYVIHDTIICP
jgi:hypothetical protein